MTSNKVLNNLINDSYKIKYIKKKPFIIFKIEDFLSDEDYNFYKNGFKDLRENENINKKSINKKYSYNSSEEEYKQHILDNKNAHEIHQTIFNEKFINYFYKKFYINYFESRLDSPKYLLKLIRPKIKSLELRKYSILEKIIFSKLTPQIEYSYMFNNARIDPHTDYSRKLISLMLYFPDEDLNEKNKASLGTVFYKSKLKNKDSGHLESTEKKNLFFQNSEKNMSITF